MDEWKVVSGGVDGYLYGSVVYLWDRRMGKKLWDLHNRYGFKSRSLEKWFHGYTIYGGAYCFGAIYPSVSSSFCHTFLVSKIS